MVWLKGLTKPIQWHSSRMMMHCELPSHDQCEWKAQKWRNWYTADRDYGQGVAYFFVAAIGLFTLLRVVSLISGRKGARRNRKEGMGSKVLALYRFLCYKTYRIRALNWTSPPLGVMFLGAAGFTYAMVLLLRVRPYYWPNEKDETGEVTLSFGGSPPVATRAGYMAIACLPFTMAFASKWNWVTLLTGVSHEKLQVYHRWTSWIMFIAALVHTFPFIVYHVWLGDMQKQWKETIWYWTGTAALVPQGWLTFMSFGPIRNRFYEFFKLTHYLAVAVFVPFLFLHCNFRLTSWDYFIATVIIYGTALLFTFSKTYLRPGAGHHASIQLLPDRMVAVTVPSKIQWTAGQHIFVRFLTAGFHAFTSHPFTIASLPTKTERGEIRFFIRPASGFTARLHKLAEKGHSGRIPVLFDGPYGGLLVNLEDFDKVLIIAGGSGGSFIPPVLEDTAKKVSEKKLNTEIHVIWCVMTHEAIEWFERDFQRIIHDSPGANIKISVYVTHQPGGKSPASSDAGDEKDISAHTARHAGELELHHVGIPQLRDIIRADVVGAKGVAVCGCGPAPMLFDIQNTVADLQLEVLSGKLGLREIYLHNEHFSW